MSEMQLPLFSFVGGRTALRELLPYNHVLLVVSKKITDLLEVLAVEPETYVQLVIEFLGLTNLNAPDQLLKLLRFIQWPVPQFLYPKLLDRSPKRIIVYDSRRTEYLIHNGHLKQADVLRLRYNGVQLELDETVVQAASLCPM